MVDRIAGLIVPVALAGGYLVIITTSPAQSGGFGSFAGIVELFSHPQALLAG